MENKRLKRLSAFLLSFALMVSFMPAIGLEVFAISNGDWLTWNTEYHCKSDETSVVLYAMNNIYSESDYSASDFSFEWATYERYDESSGEEIWKNIGNATNSTLTVEPYDEWYRCKVTNVLDSEDYNYIYFYIYAYTPSPVSATLKSKGSHDFPEYQWGYFKQDEIYDAKGHWIADTDYYYYYQDIADFNVGDVLKVDYDDNSSKEFVYQLKTYGDEEDSWTEGVFCNGDITIHAYAQLEADQSFEKKLVRGSNYDVIVSTDLYNEEGPIAFTVKNFGKIIANPNVVYENYFWISRFDNTAYIEDYFGQNVSSVIVPDSVTFSDGKRTFESGSN